MKTKTINLYSFNELSETAKQKAIEKWYVSETYGFLESDILESIETDIFKDIKLSNEEFSELCEANDYTFLECGTMQNY